MKTIAMYLPQFHQIKENDERFCNGYTEWTAVRTAEPLFEGHRQPRVPLDENYYNLLDPIVLNRQTKLAKNYKIDAFCFYHYYFGKGHYVMEKPAEILLYNQKIDIEFCFCWVNEGWGAPKGNQWTNRYNNDNIVINQVYGDKEEWIKHYYYLNNFFKDKRYIKVKNKPLFLIYKIEDIACFVEMSNVWNKLAVQDGFDGIYIVGINSKKLIHGMDANLFHAPNCSFRTGNRKEIRNGVMVKDYDELWSIILEQKVLEGVDNYFGGFIDFDNTPRYGNANSLCLKNFSLQKLAQNMKVLIAKNLLIGSDFLWINAWNEWGEGNYIEPDDQLGTGVLEAINEAVSWFSERE